MGKYIAKRIGYMLIVMVILSLLMYLVYAMIPFDRARAEADKLKNTYRNNPEKFEQIYQDYRKELGLDENVFVRYLGWVGIMPINGKYQGLLQGDFGYSYDFSRPAQDVLVEPMKNTIFINIFATILALGITIPLGIFCAVHRGGRRDNSGKRVRRADDYFRGRNQLRYGEIYPVETQIGVGEEGKRQNLRGKRFIARRIRNNFLFG